MIHDPLNPWCPLYSVEEFQNRMTRTGERDTMTSLALMGRALAGVTPKLIRSRGPSRCCYLLSAHPLKFCKPYSSHSSHIS